MLKDPMLEYFLNAQVQPFHPNVQSMGCALLRIALHKRFQCLAYSVQIQCLCQRIDRIQHQERTGADLAKGIRQVKVMKHPRQKQADRLGIDFALCYLTAGKWHLFDSYLGNLRIHGGSKERYHCRPTSSNNGDTFGIDIRSRAEILDSLQCIPDAHAQEWSPQTYGRVGK